MPDITDISKKDEGIYTSLLNNKKIRSISVEEKEWFLFKDILIALGYSRSTAEAGSSYLKKKIPDEERTFLQVELEGAPRRGAKNLFITQKGLEIFIRDCGKGETVRHMKIVRDGAPPLSEEEVDLSQYNEELIEQLLNDPELFIALLRRYQGEKMARRQKEEALDNIMKIIEAA